MEEPAVEYKAWIDLSSPESKAKIAKHLAALANYGGGWLVLGVNDDGSHSEPHPGSLAAYSQDTINSIVSQYLTPAFHCSVFLVLSPQTAKEYPVIVVPPHGAQPICAKKDGPLVNKRRIGISKGVHYTRVPGPKSVPIDSPELWRSVLHRCVVAERDALLTSVRRLFEAPAELSETPALNKFLTALGNRWDELQTEGWAVDAKDNRAAYSFQLLGRGGSEIDPIPLSDLMDALREASSAASSELSDNAAPSFDPSNFGVARPSVVLWEGEIEGYRCDAIHSEDGRYLFAPALWEATANGMGAEVRPYHEDTEWVRSAVEDRSSIRWPIGRCFSPRFQSNRAFQFVAFVKHFATKFIGAERVRFRVEFSGLARRELKETHIGWGSLSTRMSSIGGRTVMIETPVERLIGEGCFSVIADMLNPIFRLFAGWEVHPEFVKKAVQSRF